MAKEKRANDGELTKEEMLPLDEEAQAALCLLYTSRCV